MEQSERSRKCKTRVAVWNYTSVHVVCLVDYSDIIKKARSGTLLLLSV